MTSPAAAGNGLLKFLRPKLRPQSTDIQAAAMWGVSAITGALYVIQPWDFLRKTFIEKQEEEK
ncbi:ubiquinol-cytochrome c reductase complex 6.7 kDa protein [Capsicum galapagoense]